MQRTLSHHKFGELRSLIQEQPSPALFDRLCVLIGDEPLCEETLTYLMSHMQGWPSYIKRDAPLRWIWLYLDNPESCPQLGLCNALLGDFHGERLVDFGDEEDVYHEGSLNDQLSYQHMVTARDYEDELPF